MLDESFFVRALRETVEGDGVCEKDGKVLFVHGMLAGESGYVRVTETNKRYMRGELLSLTEASSERKEPSCPIAKSCGGCSWEHASREHELALKRKRVAECLSRIGGFSENDYCLGNTVSGRESHYRGKCEMRARNGRFGYLARTGEFIPAEECLLLSGQMNTILGILRDEQWRKIQGAVLRTNYKGETMLVLAGDEPLPKLPSDALKGAGVTSLWQLTPKKRMTHALDGRLRHIWGSERLEEEICGLRFSLSPQAFFQINREIAEKMYYDAVELAGIGRNDTVLDAYSGVGAIGMTASRIAAKVYAVEVIPEAVENARQAARENGIGNMECICGKCEEILPGDARFQKLGAVFLDPPRKGCDEKLLDAVAASGAKKIVYISCDPATLARDAAFLREKGYRLESATPYDMFPKAGHVECVVLLTKVQK